ncbi:hypothetical protein H671_5g14436 [Cricetulus griseus]|nr:hypothetical protein H671_5g14436 [Cricetulus griseus]
MVLGSGSVPCWYSSYQSGEEEFPDVQSLKIRMVQVFHIFARTSRTILKRYGESGQPCLVPDFREIGLSFSPFNLMLAVVLLYIAFIMLRFSIICMQFYLRSAVSVGFSSLVLTPSYITHRSLQLDSRVELSV